ncbi:MAG: tyrosine--tRNA ligase [Proteobacteria bacterium]|jgi:tyrosyl-tRNA synthetase|nr:tyrosine--tRNA ligase [Alphaproteobacteria bacterium]NCC03179.1 tyrosine--tRNA ligase [Pseudomonadota bacterium]
MCSQLTEETTSELQRGIAIITPPDGLTQKLKQAEREKRSLIIKLGFDPTAPDLHIGHAVVLRKMRDFQKAGHKLVIIIGDFTARIGDPTGRNKTRPPLSSEQVAANAETYLAQLSKVINTDHVEIRFNAEWLAPMQFADVIRLLSRMTVAQIMQREDFATRFANGQPISMHEIVYPLLQGHDSLAIKADIEIGGTDQLFNCLVGRALQEAEGIEAQTVLSMPLLVGLDGVEKMSKSKNNIIGLTEPPRDMFGKAMSISDKLMPDYLDLATDFSAKKVAALKQGLHDGSLHPMNVKKLIAANIVAQYHGDEAAEEAASFFSAQIQGQDVSLKEHEPLPARDVFGKRESLPLLVLCSKIDPQKSGAELRRLIASGAVSVNGEKVTEAALEVARPAQSPLYIKIGKRGYYAIVAE